MSQESDFSLDFGNTEVAFEDRSNKELKKIARLFGMMNNSNLVAIGSLVGLAAIKLRLPFAQTIIKNTVFDQFCGGTHLLDCQRVVDRLYKMDTLTILDYGAEGKSTEEEFDQSIKETLKAIEFAASNDSVPAVSTKLTGLADNDLLIKRQSGEDFTVQESAAWDQFLKRLTLLGDKAEEFGVGLFIDAEESWMQQAIDEVVLDMMHTYNRDKVIVYNTYQMYRRDKLEHLQRDHAKAEGEGFYLGAKLVRGAYMEKEREYAQDHELPLLLHPTKADTDEAYNHGIAYCVRHYESIGSCNASHNLDSNYKMARLIEDLGLVKNHPHLNFSQLYGMSDNITFNLARNGYNVAKYVPYGPVREVVPYLIRRAQENTSITGDVSRELTLIKDEMKRRGII